MIPANVIYGRGQAVIHATLADGTTVQLQGDFDRLIMENVYETREGHDPMLVDCIATLQLRRTTTTVTVPA